MGGGYLSNLFSNETKGFTLIELLAVIVLLAIIALITVPIVLNIIEKSRQGAALSSAKSYIKEVETYLISSELNDSKMTLKNSNKYNVTKSTTIDDKTYQSINDLVSLKGIKPNGSEDYITLGDIYSVIEAKLTINDYAILIKNDEVISIIKGKSTISLKENVSLNITNIDNKNIISTYLEYNGNVKPTCKVGNTIVNNTNELSSLGLLGDYKIECSLNKNKLDFTLNMNKLYLYKDGNEFNNITGGWFNHNLGYYPPTAGTTYAKNIDNVVKLYSKNEVAMNIQTDLIDASKYKTYNVNFKEIIIEGIPEYDLPYSMVQIQIFKEYLLNWTEEGFDSVVIKYAPSSSEMLRNGTYYNQKYSLPIEQSMVSFVLQINSYINSEATAQIDEVWLER